MYLYEQTPSGLNIYSLAGNKSKIREFKLSELSSISLSKSAYKLKTTNGRLVKNFYESNSCHYKSVKGVLHSLPKPQAISLINDYIDNDLNLGIIKNLRSVQANIYFFINGSTTIKKQEVFTRRKTVYSMNNLVVITKTLYLFHSFLKREFGELTEEDITKFIQLCDFSSLPIETIEINQHEFDDFLKCDVNISKERLEIDQKLLEKIRLYNK